MNFFECSKYIGSFLFCKPKISLLWVFSFLDRHKSNKKKKSCSRGHDFFVISQKRTVEYVFHRNLNTLTLHVSCGLFQKTKEKGGDKIVLK